MKNSLMKNDLIYTIVNIKENNEKKNEEDFANSLRENDSGHQPC